MVLKPMRKYYVGVAVIAAICAGAVAWYYVISRGPVNDQQKVADIIALQSAIDDYAQDKSGAPDSLDQLALDGNVKKSLGNYEYSHNTDTYTICTDFVTDASTKDQYRSDSDPHSHGKGRQCFTSSIYSYNYPELPDDYKLDNLYDQENSPFDSLYQ